MSADMNARCKELAVFADLGTDPPRLASVGNHHVVRMCRGGEDLEIELQDGGAGRVIERCPHDGRERRHRSYRALLASESFGNLRGWAARQKTFLQQDLREIEDRIPVKGLLSKVEDSDVAQPTGIDELDDFLSSMAHHGSQSVRVMLIDGPAGIGKTKFIEFLAYSRANGYSSQGRPLVLHVQSRGRVLTFLQDLIAFTLQRLRIAVMFDQIPVLVRHGLVTLAIDGFDELADPNGYDLAWGQVNDLVDQVRGEGTLILAGRETFIGDERLRKGIASLNDRDYVNTFSLQLPEPEVARNWLQRKNWKAEDILSVAEFFEPGSYALRPFFLSRLANSDLASVIRKEGTGNPLALLVQWMIEREAEKFGDAVEKMMDEAKRRSFVRRVLQEIARQLADDQTEALDETLVAWIVEFALPEDADREIIGILTHRAQVMAFLEKDERQNYRRFVHSQLYNHFLSESMIDAVLEDELPKFTRRNILGADFLSVFSDLTLHPAKSDADRIRKFFQRVSDRIRTYPTIDRGSRNLGALLLTMLPAMEETDDLYIAGIDVDESLIQGTAPGAKIVKPVVNQLDIRGADIGDLIFEEGMIGTLIVDDTTRVPESCPVPGLIRVEHLGDGRGKIIGDPGEIGKWLDEHGRSRPAMQEAHSGLVPNELRDDDLVKLLGRACRSRSYWIPQDPPQSDIVHRFAGHERWPDVLALLEEHELIIEKVLQSSRRGNTFHHIKRSKDILSEAPNDLEIGTFYESLVEKIRRDRGDQGGA